MPWHVERDPERCSVSKPHAVIKDDDNSLAGCHASEASAQKQLAALYASERSRDEKRVEYRRIGARQAEWRFSAVPDADGTFAGYLSMFNVTDTYQTRMMPGCWMRGGLDETEVFPLLDMHDSSTIHSVLGGFHAREDERGLFIEGRFANTPTGQEARTLAGMGFAPDLSVGFIRHAALPDDEDALTVCELVEGSLIIKGMASTPGASLVSVRSDPRPRSELEDEIRRVLAEIREAEEAHIKAQRRRRVAALRVRLLAT